VTRLDRLARSTKDLLNTLDAIAKAGAGFRSLADAWCDTSSAHGRLMLTVLGGLAEFERELIRARTVEGRARAQARGVRFGRKPALTAHQQREALARREAGEACVEIARRYAVSHSTISRLAPGPGWRNFHHSSLDGEPGGHRVAACSPGSNLIQPEGVQDG
jgi:DNA invertase Pin-like site-specific DNA recombinase